jgi:hypothetical protein
MGRGNECVHGDCEGLYYVDYDNFESYIYDFETDTETEERDYDLEREQIEESISKFKSDFMKKFKSFYKTDKWIGDDQILLENNLFYIAVCDNQWSLCFKLLQKDDGINNFENLQSKHYRTYLNGMRDTLFNQFSELGIYSGAWTSGTIKRQKNFFEKNKNKGGN